jgi:hypothetical protein
MQRALYHLSGKFPTPCHTRCRRGQRLLELECPQLFPDAECYMIDPLDENQEVAADLREKPTVPFLEGGSGDGEVSPQFM